MRKIIKNKNKNVCVFPIKFTGVLLWGKNYGHVRYTWLRTVLVYTFPSVTLFLIDTLGWALNIN